YATIARYIPKGFHVVVRALGADETRNPTVFIFRFVGIGRVEVCYEVLYLSQIPARPSPATTNNRYDSLALHPIRRIQRHQVVRARIFGVDRSRGQHAVKIVGRDL